MANISNISMIIGIATAIISILSIKPNQEDKNQNKNKYKKKNNLKEYREKNKKADRKYQYTNKNSINKQNYKKNKNSNISDKINSKLEELEHRLTKGNSFEYENNSQLATQVQSILKSKQEKNNYKSKDTNKPKNTNNKSKKTTKDKETFYNRQNSVLDNKKMYNIEDTNKYIEYEKPMEFDLRAAMIYSEILQKPLSIRNKTKMQ